MSVFCEKFQQKSYYDKIIYEKCHPEFQMLTNVETQKQIGFCKQVRAFSATKKFSLGSENISKSLIGYVVLFWNPQSFKSSSSRALWMGVRLASSRHLGVAWSQVFAFLRRWRARKTIFVQLSPGPQPHLLSDTFSISISLSVVRRIQIDFRRMINRPKSRP